MCVREGYFLGTRHTTKLTATCVGDCDPKDKPGMFSALSEKAYKYSAWEKNKGMTKEDAMQAYIDKVESMRS